MADVHKVTADDLARLRTVMAADRTLMAWIRTTLSMISFGFTIYKFLQYLYESQKAPAITHPSGPRNLGLMLIVLGVASLGIACLQYWNEVKQLEPEPHVPFRLSLVVAGFVALVGTLALLNVLFRIGPF